MGSMNSQIEWTRRLCERDPLADAIREKLQRLEHQGHQAGWDSLSALPSIFQIDASRDGREVRQAWSLNHNADLAMIKTLHGGDLSSGMKILADTAEQSLAVIKNPALAQELLPLLSPESRRVYDELGRRYAAGEELTRARTPGFRFFGYGIRMEMWKVPWDRSEEVRAAAMARELHSRPDRVEFRMVAFVARDGLAWLVMRDRGSEPYTTAFAASEADAHFVGGIAHNLSRLVAAAIDEPLPIISQDFPERFR